MSSSQDLKNSQANIAPQRKSSARNDVPEWATDMIVDGKAHVNLKTNDTLHVSAVLKKTEDRKSSGVTVHLYPNGKVVPESRKLSEITVKGAVIENVAEDADKFLEKSKV
ncbi:hypothetical protein E4U52_003606 [Claviceps spartinae]|nr:hypothetical protein E4U52_003606 [Claviceps spartinae]